MEQYTTRCVEEEDRGRNQRGEGEEKDERRSESEKNREGFKRAVYSKGGIRSELENDEVEEEGGGKACAFEGV